MSSLPIRRIRDFAISFLQIPPRDGHPCLDGWFRSLRSMGDLHPLNAYHYSTHQPGLAAPRCDMMRCMRSTLRLACMIAILAAVAPPEVLINGRRTVVVESPAATLLIDLGGGSIVDFHLSGG